MELDLAQDEPIKVELSDDKGKVTFVFRRATHLDMVYAACILDQTDLLKEIPRVDRDELVTKTFAKLTAIEGEIKKAGTDDLITVDELKAMAKEGKLTYPFASKIMIPWAMGTLKALGFLTEALKA